MGESARKAGAPTMPLTPEEALTPGPGEGFSWADTTLPPIVVAACFGGGAIFNNWRLSRPPFAGIYVHFIMAGIGYLAGDLFFKWRRDQKAEKDAILLHYVSLHPEDFPAFERQRYKDLFLTWSPKR